jgi:hypothetical protein
MAADPRPEPIPIADKGTLVWEKLAGGNIKISANGLDREIAILPDQVLELALEDTPALYASARPRWVRRHRVLAPAVATVELGEDDFPAPEVAPQPVAVAPQPVSVAPQPLEKVLEGLRLSPPQETAQ